MLASVASGRSERPARRHVRCSAREVHVHPLTSHPAAVIIIIIIITNNIRYVPTIHHQCQHTLINMTSCIIMTSHIDIIIIITTTTIIWCSN